MKKPVLRIFEDRIPVNQLADSNPDVLEMLVGQDLGKTGVNHKIQYCGLAVDQSGVGSVFLPLKAYSGDREADLDTAKLTMKVLAKYGRDRPERVGADSEAGDTTSLLGLIVSLVQDYRDNGVYAERLRYRTRNAGKIDWKATVGREIALISGGEVVYTDFRTTSVSNSTELMLAQIQAAVLREIYETHDWWLNDASGSTRELRQYSLPSVSRGKWISSLKNVRTKLFSIRSVRLVGMLISYLEESARESTGAHLWGVENFHTIWEHMLRSVLCGYEAGWNSRLPKPYYIRADGTREQPQRGMQTDLVIRDGTRLIVADAKYYAATGLGSVPGWGDIVKQIYYKEALQKVEGTEKEIDNYFIFPKSEARSSHYITVEVCHSEDGGHEPVFPEVRCMYLNMQSVLKAYIAGEKMDFEWE